MLVVEEVVSTSGQNVGSLISPSIGGGTDQAYVALIGLSGGEDVSGVTGGGLTWTQQVMQPGGRSQSAIELFTAFGSPVSAFTVTASIVGSASAAILIVMRVSGADTTTPFEDAVGHNTNGENGSGAGGTDNDVPEVTTGSTRFESMHVAGLNPRNNTISVADSDYIQQAFIGPAGAGGNTIRAGLFTFIKTATGDDLFNVTISADDDWCCAGIIIRRALVVTPTDINLDGAYKVLFDTPDVNLGAAYRVREGNVNIARAAAYRMSNVMDISKGGQYAVLIEANELNLNTIYRMINELNIPKLGVYRIFLVGIDISIAGVYRIVKITDLPLGGQYTVLSEAEVQMQGAYSMEGTLDLNKPAVYRVILLDQETTKGGLYRVILADQDINMAGVYAVITSPEVILAGEYRMINVGQQLQLESQYALQPTFDVDLASVYRMLAAVNEVQLNGAFRMVAPADVEVPSTYRISTQPIVELGLDLPLTEDAPGPEVIIDLPVSEV